MTALGRVLAVAYATASLALTHCAVRSWQHGSLPYTLLLAGCSLAALTAMFHTWYLRDELRDAVRRLEVAARPFTTVQDTAVHQLLQPCCERWWTVAGADHHCTRKDQTT